MDDFDFEENGQGADHPMDGDYDAFQELDLELQPELEHEPWLELRNQQFEQSSLPEYQTPPSSGLIPSIERTASVVEPSPVQVNDEVESSSASRVKSEHHDAMDLSHDDAPNAERQLSAAANTPVQAPTKKTQTLWASSRRSTASPRLRQAPSPTTLTPIIGSASIFGGSILRPQSPQSGPSIFGSQHSIPNKSMFGGPVQNASTYKAAEPQVDDDDDDVIFIGPQEASVTARQKWNSYTPHAPRDDNIILVKEERRDDRPRIPTPPPPRMPAPPRRQADPAKIIAAQRAMLERNRTRDNGEGSWRGHMRPSLPDRLDDFEDNPFGASDQVDAEIRDANEDHSWMDEEDEGDHEYEKWIKVRNLLARKQRSGTITSDESMYLYKLIQQIETRDRLRAAACRGDEKEQGEDSLFLPAETMKETMKRRRHERRYRDEADEGQRRQAGSEDVGSDFGDDAGDGQYNEDSAMLDIMAEEGRPEAETDLGFTKDGKPRKRRAKAPKDSREFYQRKEEQRLEKERAKDLKKKGRKVVAGPSRRKANSPVVRGRGKAKPKDKGKGKEKEKPTKKGKGTGKGKAKDTVTNGQSLLASGKFRSFNNDDPVGQMILDDLMNNDPITDRLQNPIFNRPAEDTITGSQTKATQFQLLFANIPEPENVFGRGAVRSDKAKLREASKSFGYAQCKAKDGKWLIKGMKSTLYHHQLFGAQWMVQRELSSQPPHGGMLADSMGLGKTVQTLACMVGNPPGPEDRRRKVKATLIVGPATLIKQWIEEIENHVNQDVFPKVLHYKTSSDIPLAILEDTDIVVTSYSVVMRQFPFPDKEGRLEIARNGYPAWRKGAVESMGLLHQVNWYRVVLDEAQAIKNNNARTSLACQNLKSVYRWCLTGTPLLNRLEELFPYLRFLKANYSMDWATFQKYFCDPGMDICYNRISTLLSYTMMRRTMKTTILNRPIITLPKPHPNIQYVNFSPEETIIYRITENRFRNNLNAFFKKGDASRNYGCFMVQLLRLRQCTSHPFMLERTIRESWTLEDVQELRTRLSKLNLTNRPFYEQCKTWVETSQAQRAEVRERGEEIPDDEMLPFGQSTYGHKFDMEHPLNTLNDIEMYKRVTCYICSDVPNSPMKTDCGHIFCGDCIDTFCHALASQGDEYMTCPECSRIFNDIQEVTSPLTDDQPAASASRRRPKIKAKSRGADRESQEAVEKILKYSKGKDLLGWEPITDDSSWVTKSDTEEGFELTPSTKTTALKALLLKGFEDAPLDKVVIYIQFRTLARIIGRICNSEGWGFLYLTGDSSLDHRQKAIKKFRDDDRARILVAGLKCGGLGLNFPWANRCISLDLWWNHAVEQQAFGRIFRIGQDKETYMTRIVVKNSVDMRLLTMQLHKLQNLEKAMRDGETKEREALSLKQLANLFGFLRTDGDGEILSVEADYEDESSDEGGMGGGGYGRGAGAYGGGIQEGGDFDAGDFMGGGNGEDPSNGGDGGRGGRNWRRGGSPEHEAFGWHNVGVEGYGNVIGDEDEDI